MEELAIDLATLFIREIYHNISPEIIPEVEYCTGRPLNVEEEAEVGDEDTRVDGHRIVRINEIFEDEEGHKYRVIDTLGNGTYSYVYQCQVVEDPNQFVALKILKNQVQYRSTGITEVKNYLKLATGEYKRGKEYCLTPISTFEIDEHICIVFPILQRSLFEGIGQEDRPIVLLKEIQHICKELLEALDYTHRMGLIHCDVKPDNIMYETEVSRDIKLIDFGSATDQGIEIGQYIQSRFYRSPEVMLGLPISSKIDVWSVGCIAAELYLDFAIFACDSEIDSIHSMSGLLGDIGQDVISRSRAWWKFYDMTPAGYRLKMSPEEVLTTRHLYHSSVFEELGALGLDEMLAEHFPLEAGEETEAMRAFVDFVYRLLEYNPEKRLSASQALGHPFITGEELPEQWEAGEDLGSGIAECESGGTDRGWKNGGNGEIRIHTNSPEIGSDIFSLF